MINALFYKNLILKTVRESGDLPAAIDGKIVPCEHNCHDCWFYTRPGENCTIKFIEWLYKEADDNALLTDEEIEFVSLVPDNGYIYRTAVETFLTEKMENPYENTGKVSCISEKFGLFFYNLEPYSYYSINNLKRSFVK